MLLVHNLAVKMLPLSDTAISIVTIGKCFVADVKHNNEVEM